MEHDGPKDSDLLLEVALQFGTARSLDEVLELVMRRVRVLVDADRALFALFDEGGSVNRAIAGRPARR